MKKLASSLLILLLCFVPIAPVRAEALPEELPVIISEIYPNAPDADETGHEYVELKNQTDQLIDLAGYRLLRKNSTFIQDLDGLSIEPNSYLVIYPTFALLNSGGTIVLELPLAEDGTERVIEVPYLSLSDLLSWSLVGEVWQPEAPTPGEANPEPLPTEEETDEELPAPCLAEDVVISEILANPTGADSTGGEFIELLNQGTEPIELTGCNLTTDKLANFPLTDIVIPAGGYFAVGLADGLLNGGGTVALVSDNQELLVEYSELGDDEAWANIDNVWQVTKVPTPGAANQPTPVVEDDEDETTDELAPCPAGKFRNPATNRCKSIATVASSLLPCKAGQLRNPLTNRCRSILSSGSSLKPCRTGYARNPATNRCRKVLSARTSLVPCREGYERSPETNRCRRTSGAGPTGVASFPEPGPAEVHNGVFLLMSSLVLGYGLYEYRLDLANWRERLRRRFTK